jgi:alpha-maltose-1-phosphate synthase
MVIVTHPTGNANVRNVIGALRDEKLLDSYQTTFACHASGAWRALSRLPGLGEFRRRQYDESLRRYIKTAPIRELCRVASQRLGLRSLLESETGVFSIDRIYQSVDEITARELQSSSAVACYAYEDGALRTFKAAKRWGKLCLYDLPIGYWRAARQILLDEAERRPEWAATLEGLKDSEGKLARKDEELRLADRVIVASTFTRRTLEQCPFPVGPISIVPYGADDALIASAKRPFRKSGGSLRALFVGGLSQRKGIADLFEALEMVGSGVELTLVGRKPSAFCTPLESALKKHRWIESLPRERILEEMRLHDVLVFPSLFEGFGLVVTEALSQGLPVITTSHTCGPDVLTEGEDGFIVPIREPQAIAEKLELLHRDCERLAAMSDAARKKAEVLTWESYRQGVVAVVREVLAAA